MHFTLWFISHFSQIREGHASFMWSNIPNHRRAPFQWKTWPSIYRTRNSWSRVVSIKHTLNLTTYVRYFIQSLKEFLLSISCHCCSDFTLNSSNQVHIVYLLLVWCFWISRTMVCTWHCLQKVTIAWGCRYFNTKFICSGIK